MHYTSNDLVLSSQPFIGFSDYNETKEKEQSFYRISELFASILRPARKTRGIHLIINVAWQENIYSDLLFRLWHKYRPAITKKF